MASYIGISIFEATFALFAVARYDFGAGDIAAAFTECSVVMIGAQLATPRLARRFGERRLLSLGFAAMSAGLVGLVIVRAPALAYLAVVPLGAGMAFVGPMLTSEVARNRAHHVGAALGLQQAAQSLGQVTGALLGTLLFGWNAPVPYLVAASILAGTGALVLVRR
jgi:DHA1 family multidrug resistance protein-like MFS transporter